MSTDIVDDLHAAEDRIGVLEDVMRELLGSPLLPSLDHVPVSDAEKEHERVVRQARLAVDLDSYCRPSCELWTIGHTAGDVENESTCGCPCHYR